MAIAAFAHVFVFSAKPYHFVPTSVYEEFTAQNSETMINIEDGEKSAVVEKIEAKVEVPGTSVRESVQDIVVEGGQKVRPFYVLFFTPYPPRASYLLFILVTRIHNLKVCLPSKNHLLSKRETFSAVALKCYF